MRMDPRLGALLLIASCEAPAPRVAPAPATVARNVVLIVTDDQGYGDFGFQGSTELRTPNLDALAASSARMDTFYVSPVCAPTRAALLTGRWPQRARVIDTWVGRAMLPPEEVTLAELLHDAGFATGIFGKWHLGDCFPMRPTEQGFDTALVHRGGGIGQPADPEGGEGRYTDPVLFANNERVQATGWCTDVYFDAALEWMRARNAAGERFFAYLPTNAPHGPFQDVPEELYREHLARGVDDLHARIFAMIENIDANVGRLLAALDAMDAAEDTLVLFLVDNGPNTRRYVRELRGMKGEVLEGGVRSPLLARWPAGLQAGTRSDRVSAHVDVAPTVLEACGVAPGAAVAFDGRSLVPLLAGRAVAWPDRALVIQAHRGDAPVRWNNALVRTQRWKLVNPTGFGPEVASVETAFELYDLAVDPGEAHDVAAQHADVVAELAATYERWFDDVGAATPARYEPPPIVIGDPRAPRVDLTRQDWRQLGEAGGWGFGARGEWHLDVVAPGPYDVRVLFPDGIAPERVTLTCGGATWEKDVVDGARDARLAGIALPLGAARLEAVLAQGDRRADAYQVIVSAR